LCIKLVNYWDKYTEMHGQRNAKKCTIISQIITPLHVSTLSCHPQAACNQYFIKLHRYFLLRPTNAQLFHKLSHCYIFRHYCVILREFVVSTLPSYRSMSNAVVGNNNNLVISPTTACWWCDDTRCCVMQFWPPDDKHMWLKHVEAWNKLIVKQNTYRCDDTRGCVMQFWPLDDEHMCSKHVEAWNKLIVKQNTYKCDDTRCCVMQFWPLDDEHMCSKHVETWTVLIIKQEFVH